MDFRFPKIPTIPSFIYAPRHVGSKWKKLKMFMLFYLSIYLRHLIVYAFSDLHILTLGWNSTKPSAFLGREKLILLTEITFEPTTSPIQGFRTHNIVINEMLKNPRLYIELHFRFLQTFLFFIHPFCRIKSSTRKFLAAHSLSTRVL